VARPGRRAEAHGFTVAVGHAPFRQQIDEPPAAALVAARDADFAVPGERHQERPRMLEQDDGGRVELEVRLVHLAFDGIFMWAIVCRRLWYLVRLCRTLEGNADQ